MADPGIGGSSWNWLLAGVKGPALTVTINGKQTLSCDLAEYPDLAALGLGAIALRAERGPLDVRNLMARQPE
jgi:hypothetical protein